LVGVEVAQGLAHPQDLGSHTYAGFFWNFVPALLSLAKKRFGTFLVDFQDLHSSTNFK
jgi:hypothetical protein